MEVSRIVIGSLSILTVSAFGTVMTYFYIKGSTKEDYKYNFLPEKANIQDGELIKNSLENNSSINEEIRKLNAEQLKDGCSKKYKDAFDHLLNEIHWPKLIEIKNICLLTIKKKLENNGKKLISKKEDININKLKNYDNNDRYKLTPELKDIKNKSDIKKFLFDGCQKISEYGYQGENSNTYKLVEELCLKNNSN